MANAVALPMLPITPPTIHVLLATFLATSISQINNVRAAPWEPTLSQPQSPANLSNAQEINSLIVSNRNASVLTPRNHTFWKMISVMSAQKDSTGKMNNASLALLTEYTSMIYNNVPAMKLKASTGMEMYVSNANILNTGPMPISNAGTVQPNKSMTFQAEHANTAHSQIHILMGNTVRSAPITNTITELHTLVPIVH